jgi:hypothetical protein
MTHDEVNIKELKQLVRKHKHIFITLVSTNEHYTIRSTKIAVLETLKYQQVKGIDDTFSVSYEYDELYID